MMPEPRMMVAMVQSSVLIAEINSEWETQERKQYRS